MKIFDYESYKEFVRDRIESMPQQGRGQFREIAKRLRMHTTLVSQVFGGERHLTPEQACDLCHHWGMNALETEMFLVLVQKERAGSAALKKVLSAQMEQLRKRANKFSQRLPQDKKLTLEAQSLFYSNWYYSGIRLLTSIPEFRTIDAIAAKMDLPRPLVSQVVEFLVTHGLCELGKKNEITMGPQRTHVGTDSPLISRHHLNWRVKTMAKIDRVEAHEVVFTAPLSISKSDAEKVRKRIYEFVDELSQVVKQTTPEKVCVLNIDWLDV